MSEIDSRFLIHDLITEDGAAHELATSADMQPYLRLAMAVLRDDDPTQQLDEVASFPCLAARIMDACEFGAVIHAGSLWDCGGVRRSATRIPPLHAVASRFPRCGEEILAVSTYCAETIPAIIIGQ